MKTFQLLAAPLLTLISFTSSAHASNRIYARAAQKVHAVAFTPTVEENYDSISLTKPRAHIPNRSEIPTKKVSASPADEQLTMARQKMVGSDFLALYYDQLDGRLGAVIPHAGFQCTDQLYSGSRALLIFQSGTALFLTRVEHTFLRIYLVTMAIVGLYWLADKVQNGGDLTPHLPHWAVIGVLSALFREVFWWHEKRNLMETLAQQ